MRHHRTGIDVGVGTIVAILVLVASAPGAESATAVGRFKTRCAYSRSLPDDPIVHPGDPGASHLHDFFANTTTDDATTTESLQAGATTCKTLADRSAYWVPSVYVDGSQVAPLKVAAYYELNGRQPGTIVAFPLGLRMIAGDGDAIAAQPASITDWSCLPKPPTHPDSAGAPTCDGSSNLLLRVRFPDCWDGVNLDSPDHRSHMSPSVKAADGFRHCPDTHPTAVPKLSLQVEYPTRGGPAVTLSSGGQFSAHADFWNAWDPDQLSERVDRCLNTPTACS